MITDVGKLLEKLNSPADWAIVLLSGTIGAVVDGAINIIPLPFFSPGVCAGIAASTSIGLKKSFDASRIARQEGRRRNFLRRTADRMITELSEAGDKTLAEDFAFDVELAGDSLIELERVVLAARGQSRAFKAMTYRPVMGAVAGTILRPGNPGP